MSKFEKHLGSDGKMEIGGEEFELKPLGVEYLPVFFMAMKAFSGAKEGATTGELIQSMDEEGLKSLAQLIDKVLTISFPEEPEEQRKQFGMKYMSQLMPKIIEMNTPQPTESEKKLIQKIKDAKQNTGS